MPTFSLAYTSRRPHLIRPIIDQWRSKAATPDDVEIIVAIDSNDTVSIDLMNSKGKEFGVKWAIQDVAPFSCVRGWNKAAEACTGQVIIAISDDFIPPVHWDNHLKSLPYSGWMEGEYVVHVNDGFVREICTLPILTRKRYDHFGYIFYPGYESMFCDTDLTERAKLDGVLLNAMHLLFEHHHPTNRKRNMDAVDTTHASNDRWRRGELLFNFRKMYGFPIDMGPMACEHIRIDPGNSDFGKKYAVYIQATKDDFCLLEVCKRAMTEGIRHFFFCVPDEYWSGKPTPKEDSDQVYAVAQDLRKLGAEVDVTVFHVQNYRAEGRPRIQVETHLRNDSLARIQAAGFGHILIMDGDELWVPGLLKKIDTMVEQQHPASITCRMVPVVGLPGYAIDRAKDTITVYIRADVRFRDCRSPWGHSHMLDFYGVIHFTACRRTMGEIIEKHRQSGHYDDPDYDMEGWIQKTLPNVRPGMQNVHMFKKWQIWPAARNWTAEELAYIPPSIHPFLGIDHLTTSYLTTPASPLSQVSQLGRAPLPVACQFSSSKPSKVKKVATRPA